MSRFRLRYRNTDLEMPLGDFVVGRSPSCHLALEDALVSRRHARLHSTDDDVVVEDLGSRNGVLVNGARILGPTRLGHGDRITIGEHELRLLDLFEFAISSHQVGAMKPDQAIFRYALERARVSSPDAIMFFDDLEVNVRAARDAGLRAHQVRGVDELREQLVRERVL